MRDGIAFALQSQGDMELICEATTGLDAIAAYRHWRPDVTLMDIQMPGMGGGIDSLKSLRIEWPQARVIVLTTYWGDIQARSAIKADASGYLVKNTLRTELLNTIRDVHGGKRMIPLEVASSVTENLSRNMNINTTQRT